MGEPTVQCPLSRRVQPVHIDGLFPVGVPITTIGAGQSMYLAIGVSEPARAELLVLPRVDLVLVNLRIGTRSFSIGVPASGQTLRRGLEWKLPASEGRVLRPGVGAQLELLNASASAATLIGGCIWCTARIDERPGFGGHP